MAIEATSFRLPSFFVPVCKLHFGRRFLQARLQRMFVGRAAKNRFSVRACPAGVAPYVEY